MLENILDQDRLWFYTVHFEWANPYFDVIAPFLRNPLFWTPLYVFLAFFVIINYGRRGIYWILFYAMTVSISDFTAAKFLKPYFQRIRPCRDELFSDVVRNLVPCGSGWSFPSNHATNHFAMALFICLTLGKKNPFVWVACLVWAASVSLSQVYVAVHYPVDITGGAIYGSTIGIIMAWVFNKYVKFRIPIRKKNAPEPYKNDSNDPMFI